MSKDVKTLVDKAIVSQPGPNGSDPGPLPSLADCPPLPEEAMLSPDLATGAGSCLDDYTGYARQVSPMTPALFHLSAGLWLASLAIARRLVLKMSFDLIYPNLWLLWCAATTLWRKTTGLNVARDLAREIFAHMLLPNDMTPESFLADLAGREPDKLDQMSDRNRSMWEEGRNHSAQRGVLLDEVSGLLASAGKDYGAGLVEAFLRFYDCDPQYTRSTRGQGWVTVRDAYLPLLGASTPAALAPHFGSERLWAMGWWPRFALLTPETSRPVWQEPPDEVTKPAGLAASFQKLYDALPPVTWPAKPEERSVVLGTGVFNAWQRYNKALSYELLTDDLDRRLWGTYGRLPVHVLKVSMILAALDWAKANNGNGVIIELPHLARAVDIGEQWRASAHRVLAMTIETDFGQMEQRILKLCSRYDDKGGASMRDLRNSMRDKTPAEIAGVADQLVKAGYLDLKRVEPGKQGGRPTERYQLVRE